MKKNAYLLIVILSFAYQANAQPTMNDAVQVWPDFDRDGRRLTFHSNNIDFCDYYVHISFIDFDGIEGMTSRGVSAIVGRGRRQIRTYRTRTGVSNPRYRFFYNIYRGNSAKKPDTDFIYALPVAVGDTTTAMIVGNRDQVAFYLPSDTLYACRSGVMCDDNLKAYNRSYNPVDLSQITLYHDDGSFSGYVFKGKALIAAGQKIKMGSPIAVVERDSAKYSVCLSTYFLDRNKLASNNPNPNKHTRFLPFFQTFNKGKTHLENEEIYICELTDEMRMQEMNKREKKKFLKNKKQ
jgi:hypothetical protein